MCCHALCSNQHPLSLCFSVARMMLSTHNIQILPAISKLSFSVCVHTQHRHMCSGLHHSQWLEAASSSVLMCSYAAGMVFHSDGAQGVGIVNAMRGATVAVVSHACFCSPAKPLQCLTPLNAASAATVTAGGVLWVKASSPAQVCTKVQLLARNSAGLGGLIYLP